MIFNQTLESFIICNNIKLQLQSLIILSLIFNPFLSITKHNMIVKRLKLEYFLLS